MKEKSKVTTMNIVAIFAICAFEGSVGALNPAIQKYIDAFPEIATTSIRMVSTLPSFVGMITMCIIGRFVGRKVSFKATVCFGMICAVIGGCLPFFANNWYLILALRAVFGLGLGTFAISTTIIMRTLEPSRQSTIIGYGAFIMCVFGMIGNKVVGILADINWHYSFLWYLTALLALFIILKFFKEPEPVVEEKNDKHKIRFLKTVNPRFFVLCPLQILSTCAYYVLLSGMSTYLNNKGIASASVAGTILSLYTLGGAISGLFLGKIHKKMFNKTALVCSIVGAAAFLSILYIPNLYSIAAATALCGATYMITQATFDRASGYIAPPAILATCALFVQASAQAGIFISSYYINFCHKLFNLNPNAAADVESSFLGSIIVLIIVATVTQICKFAPKSDLTENQ